MWSDNFRLSARNREENFRTTLGPGLNLLINGATTKGSISGNAGLTHDTIDRSNEIKVFPTFSAAVQQTVGPRLILTATDSYTRSDDPTQADVFGLRTERRTFQSNSFGLSADYLIDRIATQAYYRNTIFMSGGTDTVSHIVGLNAGAPVGINNTARVGYEISHSDTSSSSSGSSVGHVFTGSFSRQTGQYSTAGISTSYSIQSGGDSKIWNISLITAYGLPTGLSLSGSVGYSLLMTRDQKDTSGLSTNSNLSYAFAGRAVVSLGVFQDFRQTNLEGEDFGIVETRGYTGSFSYRFTPFIGGFTQATYTSNDFTGGGNSSSSPASTNLTASAGINWQLLHWLGMNMTYTYTLRNTSGGSVTGSGNITENRALLSFQATF